MRRLFNAGTIECSMELFRNPSDARGRSSVARRFRLLLPPFTGFVPVPPIEFPLPDLVGPTARRPFGYA